MVSGRKLTERRSGPDCTSKATPGRINKRCQENSFNTFGAAQSSVGLLPAHGVGGMPFWELVRASRPAVSTAHRDSVCAGPRQLPAQCWALSLAPRLRVIILINRNCGTAPARETGVESVIQAEARSCSGLITRRHVAAHPGRQAERARDAISACACRK